VTNSQFSLPVFVCSRIAPFQDALQLFVCPGIQVDGLDSGDVGAHATMNARASNAHEYSQVPAGPSWMLVPFAVCADFVAFQFDKCFEGLCILSCPIIACRSPSRHRGQRALKSLGQRSQVGGRGKLVRCQILLRWAGDGKLIRRGRSTCIQRSGLGAALTMAREDLSNSNWDYDPESSRGTWFTVDLVEQKCRKLHRIPCHGGALNLSRTRYIYVLRSILHAGLDEGSLPHQSDAGLRT